MSEIFNDQLTDPSSSSIFNSTSQYNNSSFIANPYNQQNIKTLNQAYNTFDTQTIDINNNPIKITENFESLDQFQYSADTQIQNATLKQGLSTESQQINYQKLQELPEYNCLVEQKIGSAIKQKQNGQFTENQSNYISDTTISQSNSKLISDDESEYNFRSQITTKDLSNQRIETFPETNILDGQYQRLDLSKNELSRMNKSIPKGVSQLILNDNRFAFLTNIQGSNLTRIELKNNRLISVQGIKSCQNLRYLDVSINFISDDQLEDLKELKDLETLIIKHNHLKDESIIDHFHQNKNLKTLDLSQNDLEDIVIQQNCYIRKLYLQQNKIESFKVINNQTNQWRKESQPKIFIQKIDISQNGLQYFDGKYLVSLRELLLQDNSLLNLDLSNNLKIKKIDLNRNQLSNIKFKDNEFYPNMKKLYISNNRIIKISFISQHLQALEELDISYNNIDDHNHFFDNISRLKNLMKLNMEGNPFDQEAKLIQKSLEQKEKNYKKGNQNEMRQQEMNDQNFKHQISVSAFETNKDESKILNSHFTSVSNRKLQFQYNSQDNNSNLLNCQLSPDIFKSIDQQYVTLKSDVQQSVDQSTYLNYNKNNEENVNQQNYTNQNQDLDLKNMDNSNYNRKEEKQIHCIDEEEEEINLRESNQKQNEMFQQKLFSDQIFESNLFKRKINQSQDHQQSQSEAKILNDQLNFSSIEEEEYSQKNLQSKRADNFYQIDQSSFEQRNSTFRKKNSTNKLQQIDSNRSEQDNNSYSVNTNYIKASSDIFQINELLKNRNKSKQVSYSTQQFDQSYKENNAYTQNKAFNDIDEEERQLKLAIETMESSLTDGSLLNEITNEMNREYKKNLNQLKEYYKDRKSKKSLRKEDGETLLQMNQTLMQKIISKLGDDPNLQQNPYFIKCKQLLEQNFQTFEPSLSKDQKKLNSKEEQIQQNKSIQKKQLSNSQQDQYRDNLSTDFICSPKFQQTMETCYQNEQNIHAREQQNIEHRSSQRSTSSYSQRQQNNIKQNEQIGKTLQQLKSSTDMPTDNFTQKLNISDQIIYQDEGCLVKGLQQNQHFSSQTGKQSSSLMSTQEQGSSVYSNNNQNQNRNMFKRQIDQSHQQHSRNNSISNNINSYKDQSLFENSNNDYLCSQPLFSDTSQIQVINTNSSPFISNINKKLYSQSSRLPSYEVDHSNKNLQPYQQHNHTCRQFSNERVALNQIEKKSNQSQISSFYTHNNQDSNFNIFISEEEFFKVFQEYLIADDLSQKNYSENRQSLTVRKKFVKLIIREVLSNCDVYYSTQTIEQIIKSIIPFVENIESIRFDQLYNIFNKNLQSYSDQFAYNNNNESISKNQQESGYFYDTQQDRINSQVLSQQEQLEDRIKTPPQIITFRGKLRETSQEKKRSNTLQSNYQQLSSQNLSTNGNMRSQRSVQQKIQTQEQEQDQQFDQMLMQQRMQKQRELSPLQNNKDNSYIFRQFQDQSIYLPTNNQNINYGDCSFLSSNNQMNTLINNERSNASFELFLQKKKCLSQLATPKSQNRSILKINSINLCQEDFYSYITPYINYILELSSLKQLKIQNSPLKNRSPSRNSQSTIKQIQQNADEFKSVELLLNQLKFQVYRMVKSVNLQALQIQQANKQKIMKSLQNIDQSQNNKIIAQYINNYTLQFFDYIILFHSTEITHLGKILETSFLKYYGESPTVFSLKKNIAIQEQEKQNLFQKILMKNLILLIKKGILRRKNLIFQLKIRLIQIYLISKDRNLSGELLLVRFTQENAQQIPLIQQILSIWKIHQNSLLSKIYYC